MVIPEALVAVPGGYLLRPTRPTPPTLVLLPGIEGDARVFLHLGALARRRGVLALDLPPDLPPHLPTAAGVLLARLPERCVVLGVSLGGLLGWAMSLLAPQRVRALVTLGTLPSASFFPRSMGAGRGLIRHLPRGLWRWLYRRRIQSRLDEEGVAVTEAEMLLERLPDRAVVARRLELIARWGLERPPPVPTLWLRGQVDREAPWSVADAVRALPMAQVQVVPGGHRAHVTHPAPLLALVEHFLRGIPEALREGRS